ncbi:hypothetical protein [Chroococcus sp. FPU101]|uniref:hypothetical protein n=1 Tax=Chroococcus sp. FPU101 TaxID=1974212 RepID=UPI001A8ECBD8|nr:hypothetical protein [Chroococcus sp. FPU101]
MFFALLPKVSEQLNTFVVGQQVVWSYKAHHSHEAIQKVPAEVVKLGAKRVQIRVRQENGEFVKRWVNQSKLEQL